MGEGGEGKQTSFAGPARGEAWGAGQAGPRAAWDLPPPRKVTVNPAGRRPGAGRRGAGGESRSCSRAGFALAPAGSPATASPGPCGGPLRGGLCGELVRQPGLCKRALSEPSDLGVAFRPPFKMRGSVFPEEGRGRARFFSLRPFSRENPTAAPPALRPFVCLPRWAGSSWRSEVTSILIPQPGGGSGAQGRPARAE